MEGGEKSVRRGCPLKIYAVYIQYIYSIYIYRLGLVTMDTQGSPLAGELIRMSSLLTIRTINTYFLLHTKKYKSNLQRESLIVITANLRQTTHFH